MSRRPAYHRKVAVRRHLRTMAPGGAIPSESPVTRAYGQIMPQRMSGGPNTVKEEPLGWTQYAASKSASSGAPPSVWDALPGGWISGDRTHENLAGKDVLWLITESAVGSLTINESDWQVVASGGPYGNMMWKVARAPWRADLDTVVNSTPSGANFGSITSRLVVVDGDAAGWSYANDERLRAGTSGSNNLTIVQPGGTYRMQIIFACSAYANLWNIGPPPRLGPFCMGNLGSHINLYPAPPTGGWGSVDPAYLVECDEGDYSHRSIGAYGTPVSATYNVNWQQ